MAEKKPHEIEAVEFRGQSFDIDKTAFASLKVQTALNLGDKDPRAANEAMNLICCGRVVEYIGRIPDERGDAPDELGCSSEDWQAFTAAVADFRQYYGVDLPLEPVDEDCSRWALLWYALPRESRTARRQSPELRWSEGEYMLASAVHALQVLVWQRTKDGRRGRNKPRPPRTPAERAEAQRRRDNALAAREGIDRILGIREGGA